MEYVYIIRQKDRDYNDDFISKDKIKLWFGKIDILYFWEGEESLHKTVFCVQN
jgi:hypothetical protein